MLTSELICVLQQSLETNGNLEVKTTWGGTVHDIELDGVYIARVWGLPGEVVVIDADGNTYKDAFQREG